MRTFLDSIFKYFLNNIQVISARRGEFETGFDRGGQTREHAMLAKTIGVKHMIILVNKMDDPTVNWDVGRYNEVFKIFFKSTLEKYFVFLFPKYSLIVLFFFLSYKNCRTFSDYITQKPIRNLVLNMPQLFSNLDISISKSFSVFVFKLISINITN